jgi:hypothetical protein
VGSREIDPTGSHHLVSELKLQIRSYLSFLFLFLFLVFLVLAFGVAIPSSFMLISCVRIQICDFHNRLLVYLIQEFRSINSLINYANLCFNFPNLYSFSP